MIGYLKDKVLLLERRFGEGGGGCAGGTVAARATTGGRDEGHTGLDVGDEGGHRGSGHTTPNQLVEGGRHGHVCQATATTPTHHERLQTGHRLVVVDLAEQKNRSLGCIHLVLPGPPHKPLNSNQPYARGVNNIR